MVYIGSGKMPAGFKGRSSYGRSGFQTYTPYIHPGMPDIGAVEAFRNNVQRNLKVGEGKLKNEIEDVVLEKQPNSVQHNNRTSLKSSSTTGALEMKAYFDTSAFKSQLDEVGMEIKKLGIRHLKRQTQSALQETQREVFNMRRAFKGNYYSTARVRGDVYDKVAQSLDFRIKEQNETKNQFIQAVGGSYDTRNVGHTATGVIGSRGANLAMLTEQGSSPFIQQEMPLGGTKRIQDKLKHR